MGATKKAKGVLTKMLAHFAWISLLISGFLGSALPTAAQQISAEPTQVPTLNGAEQSSEPPDSPGAVVARAQALSTPSSAQTQPSASQETTQKPVGTAAAEAPSTSGVAASEPAGVAIAPAKQRRARTIIIRTGAIIGAAVAVGVVVALTAGTSSKPPGAH
jgi:cytoskeletal protein RodZ